MMALKLAGRLDWLARHSKADEAAERVGRSPLRSLEAMLSKQPCQRAGLLRQEQR